MSYYIASCSCGNDSMAMVWELIDRNYPLDEIVRYNNGMDFECIDKLWGKVKQKCELLGIKCTELKPKNDFLFDMFERWKEKRDTGEMVQGNGWCGGGCRWGTFEKISTLNKYALKKCATVYIGFALDEPIRIADLERYKLSPLADWGYTQADCLEINRKNGIEWLEKTDNGEWVDLYDILDRVSCWCCSNKNLWELYNIWYYFRNTYWQGLKDMQSKLDMPMKKFKNRKFGEYGNVFDLEKVFESGYMPRHRK